MGTDGANEGIAIDTYHIAVGGTIETGTSPSVRGIYFDPTRIDAAVGVEKYLLLRVMDGKQEISSPYRWVDVKLRESRLSHPEKNRRKNFFWSKEIHV
jgi:hypothetical protein